ncbi:MAG: HAD-IIIC family phosphatase [Oscillospiraceae bacterium]
MDMLQYPFDGAAILQKKRALKKTLAEQGGLLDKKIAIVSGSTVGEVQNILELFLLAGGIRPQFWQGEYGLFYEDVVFDAGQLSAFAPDVLIVHTSVRNLRQWPAPQDSVAEAAEKLQGEYARFEAVWAAAQKLGCPVVQNNFEMPGFRHFGNMDAWDTRGRVAFVRQLNEKLAAYAAANPGLYIHDIAWLSAMHGVDQWCDDAAWYGYKYACAPAFIPAYCHSLASLVKSLFGLVKKGVVTDLDNTLWGGVIGEVGPEGIEVGSEEPAGMAYAAFQSYLKMLAERGVLLAVASKNEPELAEEGLARAESPLTRADFLAFEANWGPKSHSVAAIAAQLNIGADSLVFLDDNPAEREEVHGALPEVATLPIAQPEDSVRLVDRSGYFEVSTLSGDDVGRGEMYRQNAQRAAQQARFSSYDSYLESLEMRADIGPFQPGQVERITQLVNKTNQFNLTTRRTTAAEVTAWMHDAGTVTLAGHLVDKFGDNGLVAVLVAQKSGDALDITVWLMSCRVFKRQLEHAMFDALVQKAQALGVKTITGSWLPSPKNLLVRDFYATIGFDLTEDTEAGRRFCYTVPESYIPKNTVIEVALPDGQSENP